MRACTRQGPVLSVRVSAMALSFEGAVAADLEDDVLREDVLDDRHVVLGLARVRTCMHSPFRNT